MEKILYIGRFELPDLEATANRVVSNAKLLRDIGHEVLLAGWSEKGPSQFSWVEENYYNFQCYTKKKALTKFEKFVMLCDPRPELELIRSKNISTVIAYDFPAIALLFILIFCKINKIQIIGDVSEWYSNTNPNPLIRIVRGFDSFLRMRILHKCMDGLIVISSLLQKYYSNTKTVLLPPLVDIEDSKWNITKETNFEEMKFIYAGFPSKAKERLDILVDYFSDNDNASLEIYGITEEEFRIMYQYGKKIKKVRFRGRCSHQIILNEVKNACYSLIIRESNLKNNAGFPSKFVESLSLGTPVITTDISDISKYITENSNGYIVDISQIRDQLDSIIKLRKTLSVDRKIFDYRNYKSELEGFLDAIPDK